MTRAPDPLAADFAALLRHVRTDDAVAGRIRERHLRLSAAGDATLAGTLLDLAERGTTVAVRTTAGRMVQGPLTLVGRDVIAIGSTLVASPAIATVRGLARRDTSGDRDVADRVTFAAVLGDLAASHARVAVVVAGDPVVGQLLAAGADILTVRVDGNPPATTLVALAQVSEVTVLASG